MQKIRVVQQYVNVANNGGLKTEYESLNNRTMLLKAYEFIQVVLDNCHCGFSLTDIRFYRQAIREASPDIVHIRGAGMESLNAVIGAKLAGKGKILVTVHGMFSDLVYYSPIKRWVCKNIIERMIFGLSDGISCVYENAVQRDVFKHYKSKMLPFVYNRMPVYHSCSMKEKDAFRAELEIPKGARVGIYTGRATKEKGLSYLLEALKLLDTNWPDRFYMLIVGDGDYRQEMQKECASLQHAKQIIFAGQQEQVEKYLHASDFFITPSLHENLSISILEACAARLPCVVTNVGGNSEIITSGQNGLVISPYSVEEIVSGIQKMCNDEYRTALKQRTMQMDYSKFSDEQVDRQLKQVYDRLLQKERKKLR